jgi:transcriptional regulator with XRE-family HTH domain
VYKGVDTILLKKIALRIKKLREKNELTQEQFLNDTGIHIGRIETAKRDLSVSTLKKIAKYFNLTLSQFLKGID